MWEERPLSLASLEPLSLLVPWPPWHRSEGSEHFWDNSPKFIKMHREVTRKPLTSRYFEVRTNPEAPVLVPCRWLDGGHGFISTGGFLAL